MTETLMAMLEAAAQRNPDTAALVGRDDRLSYAEMASVVRRVACRVEAMAPAGKAVATVLPQTPLGVASILGCCASGRVCIVLNPADPAERLSAILADTLPGVVVTGSPHGTLPDMAAGVRHLTMAAALAGEAAIGWRPSVAPGPDDPAFIHATSGSTGQPKCIVNSMGGMLFRARICAESLQVTPASVVLPAHPPSEASGFGFVLGTLLAGGRMLIVDLARDGAAALLRLARRERASVLVASPPPLRMLLRLPGAQEAFASVRLVRSGAAGLQQSEMGIWRASLPPGCIVSHTYASTEATIIAEWYVPPGYDNGSLFLPVGIARPEHELSLLDEAGDAVEPGEAGELTVTSPYLAVGEWQGGRLVQGRMTPVRGRPGWRAFRTGDVMRLGADGLLRFVARADRQLKLNGIRIEPAEIECVLRREPGVTDALVVPRELAGATALDAFVEAPAQDADRLRAALLTRLAKTLPRGTRPSRVTVVQAFPMLGTTKVDLIALRKLAQSGSAE